MNNLWVVGGLSGIGEQIAKDAQDVFDAVVATGTDVDVRDWEKVGRFVAANGPFNAVAYSAGIAQLRNIEELAVADVADLFQVNFEGFLGVMRSLTATQSSGRVVAIVSDAADTPMRGSIAYCSSKAALAMAIRCSARELAPHWQVNGVSPCVVEGTPMTAWIDQRVPEFRGWTPAQAREYEETSIPMRRRCGVDEVSSAAMYLLTGPRFITGSIIKLTGGK